MDYDDIENGVIDSDNELEEMSDIESENFNQEDTSSEL